MKKEVVIIGFILQQGFVCAMDEAKKKDLLAISICKNDIRDASSHTHLTEWRRYPFLKEGIKGAIQWNGSEKLAYSPEERMKEFAMRVNNLKVERMSDGGKYYKFLLSQKHARVIVIDDHTLEITVEKKSWRERCYRVLSAGACYIKVFYSPNKKR